MDCLLLEQNIIKSQFFSENLPAVSKPFKALGKKAQTDIKVTGTCNFKALERGRPIIFISPDTETMSLILLLYLVGLPLHSNVAVGNLDIKS